ncbi:MAG TPA: hypothetical protein VFQ40_02265 [Actinomycetota bacterium]|nr:hypothetical protein [Actinomycetota bacterium]
MSDTDVRDEPLGRLLDRAAERIEDAPGDRLAEVLRRGSRRRAARLTATGTALAVFAGAVAVAGLSLPSEDAVIPTDVDDWRTFASLEDNGWTIQVPPPWDVTELPACRGAEQRIGVAVTNVSFEFRDPQGGPPDCYDRLVMAGFPRDGVVLEFLPIVGDSLPGLFLDQPDTVLPLAPELLKRTGGIRGGPRETFLGIWRDGSWIGTVRRYVGPDATSSDVRALDRMLASFSVSGAPRWVTRAFDVSGSLEVTVTRPESWRAAPYRQIVVIDAPSPILAIASPGVGDGSCRPSLFVPWIRMDGASAQRDAFDVAIVLSDASGAWGPPELPPPPDRFRFQDATAQREACGGRVRSRTFGFEDGGRPFLLEVAASVEVFREQPEVLRYILDSIEVNGI